MDKVRILIIDDEKDLAEFMQLVLEGTGSYEVTLAPNGAAALDFCQKTPPGLVFLDFVMPVMRGDAVLAALRKNPLTKKVPVILMSGLGEMSFEQKAQKWQWLPNRPIVRARGELPKALKWKEGAESITAEMAVNGFLEKPFTTEDLLSIAEEVLQQKNASAAPSGDGDIVF